MALQYVFVYASILNHCTLIESIKEDPKWKRRSKVLIKLKIFSFIEKGDRSIDRIKE